MSWKFFISLLGCCIVATFTFPFASEAGRRDSGMKRPYGAMYVDPGQRGGRSGYHYRQMPPPGPHHHEYEYRRRGYGYAPYYGRRPPCDRGYPPHGLRHRDVYRYRYYPGAHVYHDSSRSLYFYRDRGVWVSAPLLPPYIRLELGEGVTIEMDSATPYLLTPGHRHR